MKDYPKKLYMKWDGEEDDTFLHDSEDPDDLAVIGEEVLVGVYELKKTVVLKNRTEIV